MAAIGMKRKFVNDSDETAPCNWDKLSFNLTTTDMMYVATCPSNSEWTVGELKPYGDISISPAACVLNYGQGVFEGLKAQRCEDGGVVLFRPECNAKRFSEGAERLCMKPVPTDLFVEAVKSIVSANQRWVPPHGKGSLYIRPCLWGTGAVLGVSPATEHSFIIYCSPVGPYFKGGLNPIALQVSPENHRACPGGQGGIKAIGNYAAGMKPAQMANKDGFNEVIYLDTVHHKYIEEVGAANFCCVKEGVVYTPKLVGTILPGITRMSVLQIARDLGHEVREELIEIDFALQADEAFCTGTAAVIAPIGRISHAGRCVQFADGKVGTVTRKLYDMLVGIQIGKLSDKHGWVTKVDRDTSK